MEENDLRLREYTKYPWRNPISGGPRQKKTSVLRTIVEGVVLFIGIYIFTVLAFCLGG